ncbi:hypothetical protein [Arthrobacter sp. H5]|uniref:hypothetical protein n=1 Tax=Arthrobacter sp. H5 TaxID=1267973 RepID=UPI0004ADA9ED|nr:hypothetical protein [Arthrobacter sp. H5]
MEDKTRIAPEEPFPEDLEELKDKDVEALNSKVTRQLDTEYVEEGSPNLETQVRREEVNEELDRRGDDEDASINLESSA